MKKKLGDTVLFTNQNCAGAVKQVSRAYVEHPKYPMTNRKAHHQALFTAAANFRRTFAAILDHSWQGQPSGINSLAHFMKLVTMNHGDNFPGYILQPKDIRKAIPQPWPVSTGSLILNINTLIQGSNNVLSTSIKANGIVSTDKEGDIWKKILNQNPTLHDGDLLTFLTFTGTNNVTEDIEKSNYKISTAQWLIDTSSTLDRNVRLFLVPQDYIHLATAYDGRNYYLSVRDHAANTNKMYGGALIVTRRNQINGKILLTSSKMIISSDIANYYDSEEYRQMCIRSYMDPDVLTSDWYLNQLR